MREVKTQCLRRNIRSLLLNMRTEHLAQRLVQEVSSRVVALAGDSLLLVDLSGK